MFFECPTQESHFCLFITNQNNGELCEDPSNAAKWMSQATRPKTCKADNDA
jgi:hypothetical protein